MFQNCEKTLNLNIFGQTGQNGIFYVPNFKLSRSQVCGGGEIFIHLDLFCQLSRPKCEAIVKNLALFHHYCPINQARRSKWDTLKVKHHSHDVVNAGRPGCWPYSVRMVRKDPFHGQFDSIWLVYSSNKMMERLFLV